MVLEANIDNFTGQFAADLNQEELREEYLAQDEFLVIEDFLPATVLNIWDAELDALKPHIHRSYIPRHKKSGSVGYETVRSLAPTINEIYQSPALISFLSRVVDADIQECPRRDPHRCVLYAYTEEGDHIGYHYDTSYYKDRRWTVLIGFQDESSSRLVCRLHTRNPEKEVEVKELQVKRGMLVLFNGDKLHHCVTPLKANEHRYIISMQFVTSVEMNPFMRFVSNMKDSIAYFGLREVFGRKEARS